MHWRTNWDSGLVLLSGLRNIWLVHAKWKSFNRKHWQSWLKNYSPDGWSGHSAAMQGCGFKSRLRNKLLWSLTSWDSTTTTWFLGKRDTSLSDKGLTGNPTGLMEKPMWAPPCGLEFSTCLCGMERLWPHLLPWHHLLGSLGSLLVGQVFVVTFLYF